jgi:hypothetical protein
MTFAFGHTPHINKKITKLIAASIAISNMPRESCEFVEAQNGPTFHENVIQGFHVVLN